MASKFHQVLQEFVLNDSIHLILFLILLSIFYFFYVTKEEENAQIELVKQLFNLDPDNKNNSLINDIISKIVSNYPNILDNLKENSIKLEKQREDINIIHKKRTYYSIFILFIFLLLINLIIKIYYKDDYVVSLKGILFSNIISLFIIGLPMRYFFFKLIVKEYKRMDTNTVIYKILKEYQQKHNNKK